MPIIGGEGVKHEIPNDRTGASEQHNASCHDYIYWNITGENSEKLPVPKTNTDRVKK